MRRRDFLKLVGSAATLPAFAKAEQIARPLPPPAKDGFTYNTPENFPNALFVDGIAVGEIVSFEARHPPPTILHDWSGNKVTETFPAPEPNELEIILRGAIADPVLDRAWSDRGNVEFKAHLNRMATVGFMGRIVLVDITHTVESKIEMRLVVYPDGVVTWY